MVRRVGSSARLLVAVLAALVVGSLAACGDAGVAPPSAASPGTPPSTGTQASSPSSSPGASPRLPSSSRSPRLSQHSDRPILGGAPPSWLGKRVLPRTADGFGPVRRTPAELVQRRFTLPDTVPALPGAGFASRITTPAPTSVIDRSTWEPGCPVAATDLSWVRLTFRGFENRRHTGELLVNRSAAEAMVKVFRRLYAARFPIEEMRITRADELSAAPTGDGSNTVAFNCPTTTGGASYSPHANGLAVDLNPFQNPYTKGDVVLPELASSYLDRRWVRPGMITADGPVVRAFDAIGWAWGGTWRSLKDLQHFSANGS